MTASAPTTLLEAQLREIDKALLELHAKLKATTHIQVQHRLVTQIDKLLDERNRLTKS